MPYLELPSDLRLFYKIDDCTDPWTHPETVVFFYGLNENTQALRAGVAHLSRHYRLIRIDQRGFGHCRAHRNEQREACAPLQRGQLDLARAGGMTVPVQQSRRLRRQPKREVDAALRRGYSGYRREIRIVTDGERP
jgi:hypothetical protein